MWRNSLLEVCPTHQFSNDGTYRAIYVKTGSRNTKPTKSEAKTTRSKVLIKKYKPDYTVWSINRYLHHCVALAFLLGPSAASWKSTGKTVAEFLQEYTIHHRDFNKFNNQPYNLFWAPRGCKELDQCRWTTYTEALADSERYHLFMLGLAALDVNQFFPDAHLSHPYTMNAGLSQGQLIVVWNEIEAILAAKNLPQDTTGAATHLLTEGCKMQKARTGKKAKEAIAAATKAAGECDEEDSDEESEEEDN